MSIPYKERYNESRQKVKRSTSLDGIQTLNRSSIAIISWYTVGGNLLHHQIKRLLHLLLPLLASTTVWPTSSSWGELYSGAPHLIERFVQFSSSASYANELTALTAFGTHSHFHSNCIFIDTLQPFVPFICLLINVIVVRNCFYSYALRVPFVCQCFLYFVFFSLILLVQFRHELCVFNIKV